MITPTTHISSQVESVQLANDNTENSKEQIFPELKDWFLTLVQVRKPDFVVAIARSAIRVLQITKSDKLKGLNLISQHPLSFLSDEELKGKTVILFDDSVIFGSTLSDVYSYLIERGAIVHCVSYVIDREVFYGESKSQFHNDPSPHSEIDIQWKHKLWSDEIKQHHFELITKLLESRLDYNPDFPEFRIKLSHFESSDIPYLIHLLNKKGIIRKVEDVTIPVSATAGIYRYTLFLNDEVIKNFFSNGVITYNSKLKLRITFVPSKAEIGIKILPQLAVKDSTNFNEIRFFNDRLNDHWQNLTAPQANDKYYNEALHRLATIFVSTIYISTVIKQFCTLISSDFFVEKCEFSEEDVKICVGSENARKIYAVWEEFSKFSSSEIQNIVAKKAENLNVEDSDEKLFCKIKEKWNSFPILKPVVKDTPYEVLSKLFHTLHKVTDSKKAREEDKSKKRMNAGFTLRDIDKILESECNIKLEFDVISAALDVCIDYGHGVPKVIKRGNFWIRVCYSGEQQHKELSQFKDAMFQGYSDYRLKKDSKPFDRVDVHKVTSSIEEVFKSLPVRLTFNTFGRTAVIPRSNEPEPVTDYLCYTHNNPFIENKSKQIVELNPEYTPNLYPVWSKSKLRDFYDAFSYIANAFNKVEKKSTKSSDSVKLLLSTCRTHKHLFEAIAVETHSWLYDPKTHGFERILKEIKNSIANPDNLETVIEGLKWSIIFLTEIRKKYTIFYHNFSSLKKVLKNAFYSQGDASGRYYEGKIEDLLNSEHDPEINFLVSKLRDFATQMEIITNLLMIALIDFGLVSQTKLEQLFADKRLTLTGVNWLKINENISTLIVSYNAGVRQLNSTFIKTLIDTKDTNSLENVLDASWICFSEIYDAVNFYFKKHKAIAGGFNYIQQGDFLLYEDETTKKRMKGIYILSMDVIGSTNEPATQALNDIIHEKLNEKSNIYWQENGREDYLLCSDNIYKLYECAEAISMDAIRIKGIDSNFKGLRKSIIKGDIDVIEGNKSIFIRDLPGSSSLPRAVYLLEAFKKGNLAEMEKNIHNSIIVIEDLTAREISGFIKDKLHSTYNENECIYLKSKYFTGNYVYFQIF
jgi:hypothetical protein